MLPDKAKMIIQIIVMLLKVLIFSSQLDIKNSRTLSDWNSLNNYHISKPVNILSNGSFNSVKTVQKLYQKIILLRAVI